MKIVLVFPPIGNIQRVGGPYPPMPPLGILYIGTFLKMSGFNASLMDLNIEQNGGGSVDKAVEAIEKENPDVLGVTCWSSMFPFCAELVRRLKEKSEFVTIMGGSHPTALANEIMLEMPEVDIIVRHEGEYTMPDLVRHLSEGRDLRDVLGITYRKNKNIISNPDRLPIGNLDELPFPDFDLFPPLCKYQLNTPERTLPILGSRGCPFKCIFCSVRKMWYGIQRRRSPENVVAEMENRIEKYGVESFVFYDDMFTLNKNWVMSICDSISKRKLDIRWFCLSRIDTVDRSMLKAMRKAGCRGVYYGIETASPRIMKFIRKLIDPDKALRVVKETKKVGIEATVSFILGFPLETKKDIYATINLGIKMNRIGAIVELYRLSPLPGTDLMNLGFELIRSPFTHGFLGMQDAQVNERYESFTFSPGSWMYKPQHLTIQDFKRLYMCAEFKLNFGSNYFL